MDTKVAFLLLTILGALTVQGAVSGNKRTNPLHARQWAQEGCMDSWEDDEYCAFSDCKPGYYSCDEKFCEGGYMCCCRAQWE